MAAPASTSALTLFSVDKPNLRLPRSVGPHGKAFAFSKSSSGLVFAFLPSGRNRHCRSPLVAERRSVRPPERAFAGGGLVDEGDDDGLDLELFGERQRPVKLLLWVVVWASLSLAWFVAYSGDAKAAVDSIKASSFGLKVANKLRSLGWADEAVVFALATLPVIELRGAIPVGYWMQLKPLILTVLSVIGNMVPVPFIILYLKKLATFLTGKNQSASRLLDMLFERAKEKAGPVQEFRWLGLMLFVAVPFPGTGAWTGAIIASILDMPFWPAMTANFCGVVLAGLLVNLLVNLGLKYAIITGIFLFFISTFMWSILRSLKKSLRSSD